MLTLRRKGKPESFPHYQHPNLSKKKKKPSLRKNPHQANKQALRNSAENYRSSNYWKLFPSLLILMDWQFALHQKDVAKDFNDKDRIQKL